MAANWILILTLCYAGESGHIVQIDGFSSADDCALAGKTWQHSVAENTMVHAYVACIHR
jgi:hypothetical protein